jgi:hypothetical protein
MGRISGCLTRLLLFAVVVAICGWALIVALNPWALRLARTGPGHGSPE